MKTLGIMVNQTITKTYYHDKVTLLNAKLAEGLITKSQWTQYTGILKKWKVVTKKEFKTKVKKLKEEVKTGVITT